MEYLKVAIEAVLLAGKVHKKYFQNVLKVKKKSSSYNLLTVADTESERKIVSLIRKYFPRHNFLAEEKRYRRTDSEYIWVIDPLDGTNNFVSGLPIFCASVGLIHQGEVIVGAIYDFTRNELFYAQKGKGAFFNHKPIRVNSISDLRQSLLITGFYYSRSIEMERTLKTIRKFFRKRILGLRRLGAAALDLCYVACGRASGFWEFQLSPWDFCAGKLIIEEAGGRVSGKYAETVALTKRHFIVASNGKIHDKMLEVIKY